MSYTKTLFLCSKYPRKLIFKCFFKQAHFRWTREKFCPKDLKLADCGVQITQHITDDEICDKVLKVHQADTYQDDDEDQEE